MLVKAICVPSGDHVGSVSEKPLFVNCVWAEPSAANANSDAAVSQYDVACFQVPQPR